MDQLAPTPCCKVTLETEVGGDRPDVPLSSTKNKKHRVGSFGSFPANRLFFWCGPLFWESFFVFVEPPILLARRTPSSLRSHVGDAAAVNGAGRAGKITRALLLLLLTKKKWKC